MDEDEIYRQLEALKDRQDAKLPGIGAESNPLYHELDFRVQYELAIRSTRGPHVNDVHEHVRAPELVRACLLYTSPSPRDQRGSRMPSSA